MKRVLFTLLFISILLISCSSEPKVCFEKDCFEVEIVDEYEERMKGLMFRESLDENRGMLFIFEQNGIYPFWMKNTLIPLDMIWMNEAKEVVYIARFVQPCKKDPCPSYNPNREALYVLEVNAGQATNIKQGDQARFELE